MSSDPLTRVAKLRVVRLSQELEVLLANKQGGNIVVEIVNQLRDKAAESMTALICCDVTKLSDVIRLQNECKRYDEFMDELARIAREGVAFDQEISREEREELLDYLVQTDEGQQQAMELGLLDM